MKKFYIRLCVIVLLFMQINCIAQTENNFVLPQISPKSPNAAEFEKYGDIPVSLSNGTANVTIPLYTIKVGGLEIPITLSFNSNGIKPDEIPSYVGMGWNLNAGGVINYEQRGLPDYSIVAAGMFNPGSGYNSLDSLKKYQNGQMSTDRKKRYMQRLAEGTLDGEFDLYHFSYPGNSGTFYMDTLQRIICLPKANLRIQRNDYNNYTITDEKGNIWRFVVVDFNEASPDPEPGIALRPTFNENATIYLTEVTTPDNRTVSFGYNAYPFNYKTTSVSVDMVNSIGNLCPSQRRYNTHYTYFNLTNNLMTEINFDGGKVVLELSTDTREDIKKIDKIDFVPYLKKLKVYDANNKLITAYDFYYKNGNRLRLDKLVKTDGVNDISKWLFEYKGDSYPDLMARNKDHWGYANRSTPGIPEADYANMISGWVNIVPNMANKGADETVSGAGLLKKITYPTGGSVEFSYESNGVRLTSPYQLNRGFLKSGDFGYTLERIFDAVAAPAPAGEEEVSGTFTLNETIRANISAFKQVRPMQSIMSGAELFFENSTTNLLLPFDPPDAQGNGYSVFKDGITLSAGTYRYNLYIYVEGFLQKGTANIHIDKRIYGTSVFYPFGGSRVTSILHRDSVGNTLLKRYVYNDTLNRVGYFPVPDYITMSSIGNDQGTACEECGRKYTITEESIYSMSGPPIEYLEVVEYSDYNGAGGATKYTYTSNENLVSEGNSPVMSPFKANWRAGKPLNKSQYKYENGVYELAQEESTSYELIQANSFTESLKTAFERYCTVEGKSTFYWKTARFTEEKFNVKNQAQTYYSGNAKIISGSENVYGSSKHQLPTEIRSQASNGDSLKVRIKYSFDYDTVSVSGTEADAIRKLQRQNILVPIEKVSIRKTGGTEYITNGTVFTYKSTAAAIDKVYELRLNNPVAYSNYTASSITSGNFVKDSRYEEDARFVKYDNYLNVLQMQSTNNVNKSYIWDYNQLYPVCEVTGAAQDDIAYTSFETANNGNWVLTGGILDTDFSITGKRSLNLNTGNLSKSNLSIGKQYKVSYWSKSGARTITGASGTVITGYTTKGWTYYEHQLTASAATIVLSGTGLIDEVRLFPSGSEITTFTYAPLIGITSQCDTRNKIVYYEYDGIGRLSLVRDKDGYVLKKISYQYYSDPALQPVWTVTGNTRCKPCNNNPGFITDILQREEKDMNAESSSYQQIRWVDAGVNSSCIPAVWQNTATAVRCKKNVNDQNTGEQEQEQKDVNPCSSTFNQIRWISLGTNTAACPIPVACVMGSNCYAPEQKCINNHCETGIKVYDGNFSYDPRTGGYKCYWHYEFSDGSWSATFYDTTTEPCPV